MSKKYMVEIIFPVSEQNLGKAFELKSGRCDGLICEKVECGHKFKGGVIRNIPKSWLTEIKEPLSFEEWYYGPSTGRNGSEEDSDCRAEALWNAAIENDRLRTQNKLEVERKSLIKETLINGVAPVNIDVFAASINDIFKLIEEVINGKENKKG